KSPGAAATHTVSLWSPAGALLATATSSAETASGWQTVALASPVAVVAGQLYTASYRTTDGHWPIDLNYFAAGRDAGVLHAPANAGVYNYGPPAMPTSVYGGSNYWVAVAFVSSSQDTPPTVAATTPAAGATG